MIFILVQVVSSAVKSLNLYALLDFAGIPERSFILSFKEYFLNACYMPYKLERASFAVGNRLDTSTTYMRLLLMSRPRFMVLIRAKHLVVTIKK